MSTYSDSENISDSTDSSLGSLENYDPNDINKDLLSKCPFLAKKVSYTSSESSYSDPYTSQEDDSQIDSSSHETSENKEESTPDASTSVTNFKREALKLVILLYHLLQSDAVDITKIDTDLRQQLDTVVGIEEKQQSKKQVEETPETQEIDSHSSVEVKELSERVSDSFYSSSTIEDPSGIKTNEESSKAQTRSISSLFDQKFDDSYSSSSPFPFTNLFPKQKSILRSRFANNDSPINENDDLYINGSPPILDLPKNDKDLNSIYSVPILQDPLHLYHSSPFPNTLIHEDSLLSQPVSDEDVHSQQSQPFQFSDNSSYDHDSFSENLNSIQHSLEDSNPSSFPSNQLFVGSFGTDQDYDRPSPSIQTNSSLDYTNPITSKHSSLSLSNIHDRRRRSHHSFEDITDSTAFINLKNYGKEDIVNSLYSNNVPTVDFFLLPVVYTPRETALLGLRQLYLPPNTYIADKYLVVKGLGKAAFSLALECIDMKSAQKKHIIKHRNSFFDQSIDEIRMLRYLNRKGSPDKTRTLQLIDYFYYQEHLIIVTELLQYNLYKLTKVIHTYHLEPYFTLERVQSIAKQCLIALEFIHKSGVIHCDLKPENILIENYEKCKIKIVDFGGSSFTTSSTLTTYIQSRAYRAPEIILGLPYDNRIDMWSLGCILCELYSGRVLFENHSIQSLLRQVILLLGNPPSYLLKLSKNSKMYFTINNTLYETHEGTFYEYIRPINAPPPRAALMNRLNCTNELFIDFLLTLLTWDGNQRVTASQALQHPFITQTLEVPDYDANPLYQLQRKKQQATNHHHYSQATRSIDYNELQFSSRSKNASIERRQHATSSSSNSQAGSIHKKDSIFLNTDQNMILGNTISHHSPSSPLSSSECYTDTGDDD